MGTAPLEMLAEKAFRRGGAGRGWAGKSPPDEGEKKHIHK